MIRALVSGVFDDRRFLPDDMEKVAAAVQGKLLDEEVPRLSPLLALWLGLALASALLAVLLLAAGRTAAAAAAAVASLAVGGIGLLVASSKSRPARVVAVTKLYWGGLALPLEGARAIYDLSGVLASKKLHLHQVPDVSALAGLQRRADELAGNLPVFEPAQDRQIEGEAVLFGVEAHVSRLNLALRSVLAGAWLHEVNVRAVTRASGLAEAIAGLAPSLTAADVPVVVLQSPPEPVIETNRRLEGLQVLSGAEAHVDVDSTLAGLRETLARLSNRVEQALVESRSLLQSGAVAGFNVAHWSTVAHYCPFCNLKPAAGEPVRLDPKTRLVCRSGTLVCELCGNPAPPGVHLSISHFEERLFRPAYDQLLLHYREQITAIDREIDNELTTVQREAAVKGQEQRNAMRLQRNARLARLRELGAQAASLQARIAASATALLRYQKISEQRSREFQQDSERLAKAAQERADAACERIRAEHEAATRRSDQESERRMTVNKEELAKRDAALLGKLEEVRQWTEKGAVAAAMTDHEKWLAKQPPTIWEKVKSQFGAETPQETAIAGGQQLARSL